MNKKRNYHTEWRGRVEVFLCLLLVFGGVMYWRGQEAEDSSVNSAKAEAGYIKWAEFKVTCEAMKQAYAYDLSTYGKEVHLDWIDLLAYLGAGYGGDFSRYQESDMEQVAEALLSGEQTMESLTKDMQYYPYYKEVYEAVLGGLVGEYEIERPKAKEMEQEKQSGQAKDLSVSWKKVYGLKGFNPIAKTFPYTDYDDFGASRSYGYKRNHLGHDMMGQVGTPVIAAESGSVRELGWNQYGGWRIGIDSFDGKRYYYYAHLRQNRPYADGLKKGDVVQAGDVIGYIGRTGYSAKENVNNIDEYHLHFGLQLIFDESQREGSQEIWVDVYELVKFLSQNRSEVERNDATKEWTRVYGMKDPEAEKFKKQKQK